AQRSLRAAPERSEIEPGAIRRVLADTFILWAEPRASHHFRIAGTRVCALFGRDLKGEPFLNLWAPACRADLRELLAIVAGESVGVVASASGVSAAGATLALELVLLPLSHHGLTDVRFLRALAPAGAPLWRGCSALPTAPLGSHRCLSMPLARPVPPRPRSLPPRPPALLPAGGRLQHGFIVFEGGREP